MIRIYLKIHMLMLNMKLPGRTCTPAGEHARCKSLAFPGESPVLPNPHLNQNPQFTILR